MRQLVIVFLLILAAFSCSKGSKEALRSQIATEIICPTGQRYLIRYAFESEIKDAIRRDYERKIKDKSSESYTAIKIPRIESFLVEKNPPEKMMECEVHQSPMNQIYHHYIRRF